MEPDQPEVVVRTVPLYGGAFQMDLPTTFVDVSNLRQVPDHQEVFTFAKNDQSCIVELLDKVNEPDENAARFHFEQLAESNESTNFEIIEQGEMQAPSVSSVTPTYCSYCVGRQIVSKLKDEATQANQIKIFLVLFRLHNVNTDLLITFNAPEEINPTSQVKVSFIEDENSVSQLFRGIVESFQINSMDIFQT